jgi:hypothetical protein
MMANAYKTAATVGAGGKLEVATPLTPGTRVEVIVLTETAADDFRDLMAAAESSTGFWDNPIDDELWNATPSRSRNNGGISDD